MVVYIVLIKMNIKIFYLYYLSPNSNFFSPHIKKITKDSIYFIGDSIIIDTHVKKWMVRKAYNIDIIFYVINKYKTNYTITHCMYYICFENSSLSQWETLLYNFLL
jgi:hypothetical protein